MKTTEKIHDVVNEDVQGVDVTEQVATTLYHLLVLATCKAMSQKNKISLDIAFLY